jgi:predicted ATP-grasp superfamily ATP-dependent carboligase
MIESFMKGAIVIEGHVQGLSNTRSLGELGIPVYVLDVTHCLAQHSKYCTKYFRCPKFKSEEFIPFLIELAQKENLQGWFLIGSNDHIVENLSLHAQELAPYYTMIVPAKEQLYNIIDKANLMQIASTCGTHIPKTCDINTLEQTKDFTYPLLIKGREGLSFYKATHQKAIQVNNEEELHSKIQEIALLTNDVMIQELIPFDKQNRVVSFTCFAINGEIHTYWMGQKLREHPIKYGTATMSQSVLLLEVLEEAKPLMKALNYTGVCEIEFMRDPRDGYYKLIEINPRTWLWVGLAKACGIDYAKIMYRYVNGIEQTYPTTYEVGVKWRNAVTDLVFGVQAIIKRHITLCEYFSSFKGKIVKAIWSWKDIKPGLIFPFMTLYIAKKRR